jgi:SpoVK/Ycf46/Vps4 family AAA+-type ATPase
MAVDLSRSLRSLLDGAVERAESLANAGQREAAAKCYEEAAALVERLAEHSPLSDADRKRRQKSAEGYRALAAELRKAPPAATKVAVGSDAGDDSSLTQAVEALIHRSTISWQHIAGLEETKRSIQTAYALSLAEAPAGVELYPVRNILLYGPPGCGKSLLAAATSNGLDATFFNVKVSSLLSKYFGESSKLITALFDAARRRAPSVVFLDEVDALAGNRDQSDNGAERRMLANLLSELDGVAQKGGDAFVLTMAATNAPWALDPAVLSRFERKVYIPLPDNAAREQILSIELHQRGYQLDLPMSQLVADTAGMSGREIERLGKFLIDRMVADMNPDLPAAALGGREKLSQYKVRVRPLNEGDCRAALAQVRSDTSPALLERFRAWTNGNR